MDVPWGRGINCDPSFHPGLKPGATDMQPLRGFLPEFSNVYNINAEHLMTRAQADEGHEMARRQTLTGHVFFWYFFGQAKKYMKIFLIAEGERRG